MAPSRKKTGQGLEDPRPFGTAWVLGCFFFWVLMNGLLSYSSLLFQVKIWILIVGVVFPVSLFLWLGSGKDRPVPTEIFPEPGSWVLGLLGGLALFPRFFKLTEFHLWPTGDEGLQGYFALELVKGWNWHFFYTSGQHPPLLIWILTPLFHLFRSVPDILWVPPALFSAAAFYVSYWAVRPFLSRTVAFLFFVLMGFSFWPWVSGRWCVQGALVPFFEMVCFGLMGRLHRAGTIRQGRVVAVLLGAWLGFGSFTYSSWLVVIPAVFLWVFCDGPRGLKKDRISLGLFLGTFALFFAPWIVAAVREGFGGYAKGLSMASGFFQWKDQFLVSLSYPTALFWGSLKGEAGFGPTWGGVLNPILSACFCLGVVEVFRSRFGAFSRTLILGSGLFMLPGLLTADHVEMYRIIQVMPLLLLVVALGMEKVLILLPRGKRIWCLGLLMGLSSSADFYHLLKPRLEGEFPKWRLASSMEEENYKAYLALQEAADHLGPGLIFTDLMLLTQNHTLGVGVYPFNALDNPRLDPSRSRWAGIVVNRHYQPFLAARFPGSQWRGLSPGHPEDGGTVVGLIPLTEKNRESLTRWIWARGYFHRLGVQAENAFNSQKLYRAAVDRLPEGYPLMAGDPFLESFFGEWMAQYHFGNGLNGNILALERASANGYPAAHLYFKLGNFLYTNHQIGEARIAFETALHCRPNFTAAGLALKMMDGLEGDAPKGE